MKQGTILVEQKEKLRKELKGIKGTDRLEEKKWQ